jgi:Ca2+/H+ antiporter, TMEM165/GDT1 family
MMDLSLALGAAALPAFVASTVEFVEAFTIVLAVGSTRGWRAPLWGTAAAILTLAVIVVAFGTPLVIYREQVSQYFHLAVGTLLLLFGMRWLRKSILRFAHIIALHDEDLIYQREVAELRTQALAPTRWDNIGFWFSWKAVLLEGLEVAFIVIALGARGPDALTAATIGAAAAFVVTMSAGLALRKPLTFVPENWLKFLVGAMLVTFGTYWGAQGLGARWALHDVTLVLLFAGVCLTSWLAVALLNRVVPQGAQVAAHSV